MKTIGIIPARYASTRFPGKPLALIAGKPPIQRVVEQCRRARTLSEVIVATDDAGIAAAARAFCRVEMTRADHPSGTDRIAEVAERCACDAAVNVQGDEPLWSREESIIGHHKRHPFILRARWGATKEGKVVAARCEVIQDGGAYAYTSTKVLGNATLMCTGPYEIEHVSVDSYWVYTNHVPGGAFRGFGGPQGAFAAECQLNNLCGTARTRPC